MISIGINTTGKNLGQNYGLVTLNGLTLPNDCIFSPEFEKTIAKSQIVDGVEVFQRISRKSTSVTFDFTLNKRNIYLVHSTVSIEEKSKLKL